MSGTSQFHVVNFWRIVSTFWRIVSTSCTCCMRCRAVVQRVALHRAHLIRSSSHTAAASRALWLTAAC
eukprot:1094726-Rhodomonas_salina.1